MAQHKAHKSETRLTGYQRCFVANFHFHFFPHHRLIFLFILFGEICNTNEKYHYEDQLERTEHRFYILWKDDLGVWHTNISLYRNFGCRRYFLPSILIPFGWIYDMIFLWNEVKKRYAVAVYLLLDILDNHGIDLLILGNPSLIVDITCCSQIKVKTFDLSAEWMTPTRC